MKLKRFISAGLVAAMGVGLVYSASTATYPYSLNGIGDKILFEYDDVPVSMRDMACIEYNLYNDYYAWMEYSGVSDDYLKPVALANMQNMILLEKYTDKHGLYKNTDVTAEKVLEVAETLGSTLSDEVRKAYSITDSDVKLLALRKYKADLASDEITKDVKVSKDDCTQKEFKCYYYYTKDNDSLEEDAECLQNLTKTLSVACNLDSLIPDDANVQSQTITIGEYNKGSLPSCISDVALTLDVYEASDVIYDENDGMYCVLFCTTENNEDATNSVYQSKIADVKQQAIEDELSDKKKELDWDADNEINQTLYACFDDLSTGSELLAHATEELKEERLASYDKDTIEKFYD